MAAPRPPDDAARIVEHATCEDPTANYARALIHEAQGEPARAAAHLLPLWNEHPSHPIAQACIRMAVRTHADDDLTAWAEQIRRPVPVALALRAVGFDPAAGLHVTEAWLAAHGNDRDAVRKHLEAALAVARLPSTVAHTHADRALLLYQLDDPDWERSVQLASAFGGAPRQRVRELPSPTGRP